MTFQENDVRDQGQYEANPFTQDISKSPDEKSFQQSPLTKLEHEDPALHYIGETLPKPGTTEADYAGSSNDVGTSPIPARANHRHDLNLMKGVYNRAVAVPCPPGSTLITLDHLIGSDYKVSATLLSLPDSGYWFIHGIIAVARAGGGAFAGQHNVVFYYSGGASSRQVWRNSPVTLGASTTIPVGDFVHYIDSSTKTFEMAYQHNDAVNHNITISTLTLIRLSERA